MAIISTKRLLQMARKWRKMAAMGRKRLSWSTRGGNDRSSAVYTASSTLAKEGTFVVYTQDGKRFMISLEYIHTKVFRELFEMSEEVFGLPSYGPIQMPFDADLLQYILSLMSKKMSVDAEKALLNMVAGAKCSSSCSLPAEVAHQRLLVATC